MIAKKLISSTVSLMVIITSLTGCSGNRGADANKVNNGKTTETVKISVANWPKEQQPVTYELYKKYLKEMNDKYPNITVEPQEWSYDLNSFLPKAASGQLPTIYSTFFTEPDKIIQSGYAADVTELAKKYGYDKAANPQFLDLATKNGKIYGIPISGYVLGMWYNMNLLKQAGELDENGIPNYPETYEELAQLAKRVKDKTGKPGLFINTTKNEGGWKFMSIAWSYGAEFIKKVDDKWKATFNSPEAVQALQYVKDLKWKYDVLPDNVLVDEGEFLKLFGTDQVAMGFYTPQGIRKVIDSYKMNKDNVAMSKMPKGLAERYALTGGELKMFAPNATPEQLDACFKWMEIIGLSPKVTDEQKQTWEADYKRQYDLGYAVGPQVIKIWTDPERVNAEEQIKQKYVNVNMNLFSDYSNFDNIKLRPEEPVCTQELYKTLDVVIQTVLTDKNADPKGLLDRAVNDFQKNYLDQINH